MSTRWARLRGPGADGSRQGGYVAVMTALLLVVFMGISAFAVDVGRWYLVGQQAQRAADAAAMAGVTSLPGDQPGAFATAKQFAKINGFNSGSLGATVSTSIDTKPSQLRVNVSSKVNNFFGALLGVPTTTIGRSAVADFAGPVPMGSPCNEFGDDPDINGHKSTNCNGTGAFWANVGSPLASKGSGDAYQNDMATNTDYDPDGYSYSITVRQTVASLTVEAFDPAMINVGDYCTSNNLVQAKTLPAAKTVVSDPLTRYADGSTSYCTGDNRFGGTGEVATQFTVRSPGLNPWDPLSGVPIATCTKTFLGYNGDLNAVLDKTPTAAYTSRPDVAQNFRQWKNLCTISNAQPGTYMIQVKTNGVGNDAASGHNRFSLRAYGGSSADNDVISLAGYDKMAMYANTPNGTSKFFLAKVPSSARGQMFNVNLWDIGDGAVAGSSTVTLLPPVETGGTFSGCTGGGVQNGPLPFCQINVSSSFNAKWQSISVPISPSYTCNDAASTGCWLRLEFFYGTGSNPADTTSWTASIMGDPVRLVQ